MLGLVAFCVAVGFGVLVPVLPVFARSFGVGNAEVGAVISAFALMRLISSPFCGWLIKILSERIIMATGIFIVAISSGLAGLSRSYPQLLVLRGLGGIGSAMFTVAAFTLLLTSVEAGLRGRAAGFFQAGFLIGGITGPALGGVLSAISLTAPFFFYAGTLVVAGTAGLVLLRRRSTKPDEQATEVVPFRTVVRDTRYQAACFSNLAQVVIDSRTGGGSAPPPGVLDRHRVCLCRGGPDRRGRPGRALHRYGGAPACHDPRRHRCSGIDHGGTVRTEHLAAHRRALSVRHRLSLPGHRSGRRGRRCGRTSEWHGSRGVLDVF